jgi:fructokinase
MQETLYGGIEAGGTKFVCILARGPQEILATQRFPTTNPQDTLGEAIRFFKNQSITALGIACFGPVDLDLVSPSYGFITSTPKPGWMNTNIVGTLKSALQIPVFFETDVNAAALAEFIWGGGRAFDPLLYLTIGTGIGGGCIVHGKPVHGLVHPEMGHLRIPHDWNLDPFPGVCPYHGDCFEGMASGVALRQRWGQPAETLPDDHPAWHLEGNYLALALVNLIVSLSPRRIVLGGGVMQKQGLFPLVREKVGSYLNGYVISPTILEHIDDYIIPPVLENRSGALGAIALCMTSD